MRIAPAIITLIALTVGIHLLDASETYSWNSDISSINSNHCYECHCSNFKFLCDYERAMAYTCTSLEETMDAPLIAAGEPDSSCIVWRLEGVLPSGDEVPYMPQGRDMLSEEDIQVIRDWIAQGAPKTGMVDVKGSSWGKLKRLFNE